MYLCIFDPIRVMVASAGVSQGTGTQPAYAAFHPRCSKIKVRKTCILICSPLTMTIQAMYDMFYPAFVFSPCSGFGCVGWRVSQGTGTQHACSGFHHRQLKIRKVCNFVFDILTTHNAYPSYVKHVLGNVFVLFTLIWYLVPGGRGLRRNGTKRSYMHASLHLCTVVPQKLNCVTCNFRYCD